MRVLGALLAIATLSLASEVSHFPLVSVAEAQSFNCRYAKTADEVLICQSPGLAALDEQMSSLYFRLKTRLYGSALAQLESTNSYWLSRRMSCGRNAYCIEQNYNAWIADLASF